MKKIIIIFLCTLTYIGNAQEVLQNKNGKTMLPEKGDWSISLNSVELLEFGASVINLVTGVSDVTGDSLLSHPTFRGINNSYSISAKRFVSENKAQRLSLAIFLDNSKQTAFINPTNFVDTLNWPNNISDQQVKDIRKYRDMTIALAYGNEWKKGSKRLQGYYGYETILILNTNHTKYKYGNDLSNSIDSNGFLENNIYSYSTDWGGNISTGNDPRASRIIKNGKGMNLSLGMRGFIGVEYFIIPKISFGGEFGWGAGYFIDFKGKQTEEGIDVNNKIHSEVESDIGMTSSGFTVGSDRADWSNNGTYTWMNSYSPSGNISLNLYF